MKARRNKYAVRKCKNDSGTITRSKTRAAEVLTREVVRILNVKPEAVELVIDEYPRENWASAGQLYSDK